MTHICVSTLTIIGSDNGLSPGRRQAIIWTSAGILLIRTLGTNFNEILGKIHSFSFKKMHLKMSSAKGRLLSLGLSELNLYIAVERMTRKMLHMRNSTHLRLLNSCFWKTRSFMRQKIAHAWWHSNPRFLWLFSFSLHRLLRCFVHNKLFTQLALKRMWVIIMYFDSVVFQTLLCDGLLIISHKNPLT